MSGGEEGSFRGESERNLIVKFASAGETEEVTGEKVVK